MTGCARGSRAGDENKLALHFIKFPVPNVGTRYRCRTCDSEHSRSSAYKHLQSTPCGRAPPRSSSAGAPIPSPGDGITISQGAPDHAQSLQVAGDLQDTRTDLEVHTLLSAASSSITGQCLTWRLL